jgi:hypothetical protein
VARRCADADPMQLEQGSRLASPVHVSGRRTATLYRARQRSVSHPGHRPAGGRPPVTVHDARAPEEGEAGYGDPTVTEPFEGRAAGWVDGDLRTKPQALNESHTLLAPLSGPSRP